MTIQHRQLYFRLCDSQKVISLSTDTVERAIAAGKLTGYKVGRSTLISVTEADAWIRSTLKKGGAKGE